MSIRKPALTCCRIVELAARLLPADRRERYAREFVAELYDMPRSQQLRYALHVLVSAWSLRTALTTQPTTSQEGTTMTIAGRRSWKCRVRLHDWEKRENPETEEPFELCRRCDAYRDRIPPSPGAGVAGAFSTGMGI